MIYRITNFSSGPHYDEALVEADSVEEAVAYLQSELDEDELPETIWGEDNVRPPCEWRTAEVAGPVLTILGAGCR